MGVARQIMSGERAVLIAVVLWGAVTLVSVNAVSSTRTVCQCKLELPPEKAFSAKEQFQIRKAEYDEGVEQFERTMMIQTILIGLAVVVAWRKEASSYEQVFGIRLPLDVLYVVVPVALIYTWGKFGLQLNELIQSRLVLWRMLDAIGDPVSSPVFSLRSTLRDHGVLDCYFVQYYPGMHAMDIQTGPWLHTIVAAAFGVFVGSTHGALLGTVWNAMGRWEEKRGVRRSFVFLLGFSMLLLWGSHFEFAANERPTWIPSVIIPVGVVTAVALRVLSLRRRAVGLASAPAE